jgi:hypothetical protein
MLTASGGETPGRWCPILTKILPRGGDFYPDAWGLSIEGLLREARRVFA